MVAYEQQNWRNLPDMSSPITAERLNHMEDGIAAAQNVVQNSVNAADYGLADNKTSAENGAAILAAQVAAGAGSVWIPAGRYPTSVAFTDMHVNIDGPGELVHELGKQVIDVAHTPGPGIPVTVTTGTFGPNVPTGDTNSLSLTSFSLANGNYSDFQSGQVYYLESKDAYPWALEDTPQTDPTTINIWKAEFVPVLGIAIELANSTGSASEGRLITGTTSGATARVDSMAVMNDNTTRKVVVSKISKNFVVGEAVTYNSLNVGTVASVSVLMHGTVSGAYNTSANLHKVRTDLLTRINVTIDTPTGLNTDDFVTSALRTASRSIYLHGVVGAQIKAHIKNGWTRAVVAQSCYRGTAHLVVDHLPNHATEGTTGEMAYGYGFEALCATSDMYVEIYATETRHAFTTNSSPATYATGSILQRGTPKRVRVHGDSIRSYSAGWDTHPGAEGIWFDGCRAIQPGNGNRFKSDAPGFQDRSFGTTITNAVVQDAIAAISFATGVYTAETSHKTRVNGIIGRGLQRYGYIGSTVATVPSVAGEVEITNFEFNFDGKANGLPYYQIGLRPDAAIKHSFRNGRINRFNGAPIWARNCPSIIVENVIADYSGFTSGATGLRVDSTMTLSLKGYSIVGGTSTYPSAILRNEVGNSAWEITGSLGAIDGVSPPLITVTAGTPTVNFRERPGRIQYRTNNTYAYVVGLSSPVHVYNTALGTGNTRTFSLPIGPGVPEGETVQVVRTAAATGTTTLTLVSNGVNLKQVEIGTWTRATYDGSAWIITSSGSL